MNFLHRLLNALPEAGRNIISAPATMYGGAAKGVWRIGEGLANQINLGHLHNIPQDQILNPQDWQNNPNYYHAWNPLHRGAAPGMTPPGLQVQPSQQFQPSNQPLEDSLTATQAIQPTSYSPQTSLNGQLTQGPMSNFYRLMGR